MISNEKKNIFTQFYNWFLRHRKLIIIINGSLILIIAIILTVLFLLHKNTAAPTVDNVPQVIKVEPIKYYSPLTGRLVDNEASSKQPVTGIMIPNNPEARPQSGLFDAGIVFEAICEGGITRFLTLFQSEKPQLVGPVRSVRMYYLSWAAGFQASIAHVGGNMDVMAELQSGNYRNIDEFSYADAYWRSDDRWAPHNMYTSFNNLDALNASLGYTASTYTAFPRIDGVVATTLTANNINVQISSDLFNSSYVYNATTNTYDRYQAGEVHLDREKGQISPSTVITMFVDEESLSEPETHEQITTIGTGRAIVFQNGIATEAVWEKNSQFENISFNDIAGVPIPLNRGQTWITAVPNGRGDVTWN